METSSPGLSALPRPVAMAVGGGGVFGAAHVGFGYALEERGFVPDRIVGTSAGAINGAIAATHPGEAAPWLDRVWTHLRRREVFPLGYLSSRGSIAANRGLRRQLARAGLPRRIEELEIPFAAVATDLSDGTAAVMSTGDLESALLASSAIPGVLPPVVREGRTLIDGGIVAQVPVRAALQAGAASIVVLLTERGNRPLHPTGPPLRAQAVAFRAALLLMHQQIERDLLDVSRQVPTVVLPTGIAEWPAPWDFRHSRGMIDTASRAAGHFLDELHVSGPGLYRSVGTSEPHAASPTVVSDAAEGAAETTPALEAGR